MRNIRGRYPLATLGVFFLADAAMVTDAKYPQLVEMLERLRRRTESGSAYDATGLVVAEALGPGKAKLRMDEVPASVALAQFFLELINMSFTRLPKSEREDARAMYGSKQLPTAESQTLEAISDVE